MSRLQREATAPRVALITGASSGIGAALAVRLGRRGMAVALLARRGDLLLDVAREVEAAGGRALALPTDVTDRDAVRAAVERTVERFGVPDLVVANAGLGKPAPLLAQRAEDFTWMFRVNVEGAWNVVRETAPAMVRRGSGHVVGISSLAALLGLPGSAGYAASKAALSTWFEGIRAELSRSGVRVTTIHPGFIDTDMLVGRRHAMPWRMDLETGVDRIVAAIDGRKQVVWFPRRLRWAIWLVRRLPLRLRHRILLAHRGEAPARPPAGLARGVDAEPDVEPIP